MKKIILVLLCILMISACNKKPAEPDQQPDERPKAEIIYDGAYYVKELKDLKIRDKNRENDKANAEFADFLLGVFEEMTISDFMEFHYNIADYKALGLEKPEPKLWEYHYGNDEELMSYYTELLSDLRSFDYESLSYDQQYDFDCLEFECLSKMADCCFYKFNFHLKPGESALEDIASYFTDYTFNNEEAIRDYLICLKDVERVCDDVLAYTASQAKDGYPMLDAWIDGTVETCNNFINSGDHNDLITSFDRRIDRCEWLAESDREAYKAENKEIVISLFPVYGKVKDEVELYRGKADPEDYRLAQLDKNYAEYVYMNKGSNNYSVDDMFTVVHDAYSQLEAELLSSSYDQDSWAKVKAAGDGEYEVFDLPMEDMIRYLTDHIADYFPDIGKLDYTVEMLDPDSAADSVVAYYWQAPIDDDTQNIIRVNPNASSDIPYQKYNTMSHEGVPGHMYQTIFYHKQKPSPFRTMLFDLGYLEGWAEYSSYYAFRSAGLDDDYAAAALYFNVNDYFLENSLVDIMVNYYGYSAQDIYDFFAENGLYEYSLEYCELLKEVMIEYAGQYIPYGVGMSMLFELRDAVASDSGDDFDIITFHKAVLDSGVMPFQLLRESVYQKLDLE